MIIFIGKLYILFNIKLFCSIIIFIENKDLFSLLKVLLFINNALKSINIKNKIKIKVKIKEKVIILGFKENTKISFEAKEVMYINKINIPPIKIKNKE